jgi:multicomponent Na+:H+ antiporter subunit E
MPAGRVWNKAMLFILRRFTLLFGAWLVITGAEPQALVAGALTAAAAVAVSLALLPPGPRSARVVVVLGLIPRFLADSLLGGIDVARRAFHPRVPVRPGWITYPLRLPSGAGRVSLGNFLSLMPGTLAAGEYRDGLCVHCLDVSGSVTPKIAREEILIARSMGISLEPADE